MQVANSRGEVVGSIVHGPHSSGPCIYGTVPVVVDAGSSARMRIFAAIASRESPLRSSSNPARPAGGVTAAIDGAQAWEAHGVSAGAVHWISANGNLQRLLYALCQSVPEMETELSVAYSFSEDHAALVAVSSGDPLSVEDYRTTAFVVWMHELLGLHFMKEECDEEAIAAARAKVTEVQCAAAWKLINERDNILQASGWYAAVMEDERLRLITASMAINTGIGTFEKMLEKASDYTSKDLTDARIKVYQSIGAGFGVTRSNWELNECKLVVDGQAFNAA